MFPVPHEDFTIKTNLPPLQAAYRLRSVIEPERFWGGWGSSPKPYQGSVTREWFSATHRISYRKAFLPTIEGEIIPELNGCSIHFRMQLHPLVVIFMVIWLGFIGHFFLTPLSSIFFDVSQPVSKYISWTCGPVVLIGLASFAYAITLAGFKFESAQSKGFFRSLFRQYTVDFIE